MCMHALAYNAAANQNREGAGTRVLLIDVGRFEITLIPRILSLLSMAISLESIKSRVELVDTLEANR